jgi:hypothetical protein
LARPSSEAQSAIDELGISLTNARGEFRSIPELVGQFQQGLEGLTQEQRQNRLSTIVGTEALSAFSVLLNSGEEDLENYANEIRGAEGASKQLAETQRDTVQGSFKELGSVLEDVQISIFQTFQRDLQSGLDELAGFIRSISDEIVGFVNVFVQNFRLIASVLGGVTTTALAYQLAVKGIALAQNLAATGSLTFASALRVVRTALISTGIGAVIVALGSLAGLLASNAKAFDAFKRILVSGGQVIAQTFMNFPEIFSAVLQVILDQIDLFASQAYNGFINFINDSINAFPQFVNSLVDGFNNLLDTIVDIFKQGSEIVTDFLSNPLSFDFSQYASIGSSISETFADALTFDTSVDTAVKNSEESINRLNTVLEGAGLLDSTSSLAGAFSDLGTEAMGAINGIINSFKEGQKEVAGGAVEDTGTDIGADIAGISAGIMADSGIDDAELEAQRKATEEKIALMEKEKNAEREKQQTKEETAQKEKELQEAQLKRQAVQVAASVSEAKTAKEAGKAVANSIRDKLKAYAVDAVAGAVSKTLASVPFPLNLALAGAAAGAVSLAFNNLIPEFAKGVTNFGGGLALVGEEGPELVTMGKGSNVITNENTTKIVNSIQNDRPNRQKEIADMSRDTPMQSNSMQRQVDVKVQDIVIEGEQLKVVLDRTESIRANMGV